MSSFIQEQSQSQSQSIFEYAGALFETLSGDSPAFGIIKLDALADGALDDVTLDIQLRVDNSGSMADTCRDGRTQMQHVNFAVEQIIRKIARPTGKTMLDIQSFDDNMISIVNQELTLESVSEIVNTASKIFPNGGTNIQQVLVQETLHPKDASSDRIFMILSDGHDTTYCSRGDLINLAKQIDAETHVITIGVGNNHDTCLFRGITTARGSGHYKPVSNVEDISVAISELIYGILHKVLKRPVITVSNGEIYDWTNNAWANSLSIDDIVVGRKKTFNVRSLTPHLFEARINGTHVASCAFEMFISDIQFDADLKYDKYRHRTMELLGESASVSPLGHRELKSRLKNMMVELKAYMDENKLRDDKKFQVLCDDIFMCHQTMGSAHGTMYACARQTSQGTQSIYNNVILQRDLTGRISRMHPNDDDDDDMPLAPPTMMRQISCNIQQMNNDEDLFESLNNCSLDLFSAKKMSRNPACVRNCTFALPIEEDDEEEEVDNAGDDAMRTHQMLASDDSPYANAAELTFMREVSS